MSIAMRVLLPAAAGFLLMGNAAASDHDALAREILAELIAVNTAPSGNMDSRPAVAALVERLEAAGFDDEDISVLAQSPPLQNLVVRYRSPDPQREPVLMMAHIDVVEALPEDWSVDPFVMLEQDGYYYGRGSTDNKAGAAIMIANFIRLKREGFEPDRDLIVMLTADEETTGAAALWLANDKRELIDAAFALNTDAGLVMLKGEDPLAFMMQTSEKMYVSYRLEAHDPGGHSSLPRFDNPIYRIARTLVSVQANPFPVSLNDTSRAFFERWSAVAPPQERNLLHGLLADPTDPAILAMLERAPYYNSIARTTCVATEQSGGHAENALPQTATAVVNCRIVPQSSNDEVMAVIESFAAPNDVSVAQMDVVRPSPASPLDEDVVGPITDVAREIWPGIPVIPEMSTGATDGLFVRNAGIPVYGVSAIAEEPNELRAHGKDERIRIQSFVDATEYWYRLTKRLASQDQGF